MYQGGQGSRFARRKERRKAFNMCKRGRAKTRVPTPEGSRDGIECVAYWSWITYHFGLEGWLHLTFLQQRPVDGLEEGVGFDIPSHSQPLGWISFKQLQPSRGPG